MLAHQIAVRTLPSPYWTQRSKTWWS